MQLQDSPCGLGQGRSFLGFQVLVSKQKENVSLMELFWTLQGEQKPTPSLAPSFLPLHFFPLLHPEPLCSKPEVVSGLEGERKPCSLRLSSAPLQVNIIWSFQVGIGGAGSQPWYSSWAAWGDAIISEKAVWIFSLDRQQLGNPQLRDLVCDTEIQLLPLQRSVLPKPELFRSP